MNFFITRHPQTEWNKVGLIQGYLDSSLTEFGVETAHRVGEKIVGRGVTVIVSSDLGRCKQTSAIINEYLHVLSSTQILSENKTLESSMENKNRS